MFQFRETLVTQGVDVPYSLLRVVSALPSYDAAPDHVVTRQLGYYEVDGGGEQLMYRLRCRGCRRTKINRVEDPPPQAPALDWLTLTFAKKLHSTACGCVHLTDE